MPFADAYIGEYDSFLESRLSLALCFASYGSHRWYTVHCTYLFILPHLIYVEAFCPMHQFPWCHASRAGLHLHDCALMHFSNIFLQFAWAHHPAHEQRTQEHAEKSVRFMIFLRLVHTYGDCLPASFLSRIWSLLVGFKLWAITYMYTLLAICLTA